MTVNKLTERKTVRQGEVGVREGGNQERGNKQGKDSESDGETERKEGKGERREKWSSSIQGSQASPLHDPWVL